MSSKIENKHNIKNRPAWRVLVLVWLTLLVTSILWLWFGWLWNIPFLPVPSIQDFLYLGAIGLWFWLFVCLKGMRAIHEGLHAIAAHWFGAEGISAKGPNVFVRISSKRAWTINVVFPLILPLSLYFLVLPFNWRIALTLTLLLSFGSIKDLASLTVVLAERGIFVSDTTEGLFVFETLPEHSSPHP